MNFPTTFISQKKEILVGTHPNQNDNTVQENLLQSESAGHDEKLHDLEH